MVHGGVKNAAVSVVISRSLLTFATVDTFPVGLTVAAGGTWAESDRSFNGLRPCGENRVLIWGEESFDCLQLFGLLLCANGAFNIQKCHVTTNWRKYNGRGLN